MSLLSFSYQAQIPTRFLFLYFPPSHAPLSFPPLSLYIVLIFVLLFKKGWILCSLTEVGMSQQEIRQDLWESLALLSKGLNPQWRGCEVYVEEAAGNVSYPYSKILTVCHTQCSLQLSIEMDMIKYLGEHGSACSGQSAAMSCLFCLVWV